MMRVFLWLFGRSLVINLPYPVPWLQFTFF